MYGDCENENYSDRSQWGYRKSSVSELSTRHEIITVGRNSGDIKADIADRDSIV